MNAAYYLELLIVALCAWRGTYFVVQDSLIEEARDWYIRKVTTFDPDDRNLPVLLKTVPMWRRKAYSLATCPYCVSAYVSAAGVVVLQQLTDIPPGFWGWVTTWGAIWTLTLVTWAVVEGHN